MKKTILLLILLQITVLFNGCSSGSEDDPAVNTPPKIINATIQLYSKDYGTTGDTITITGEKFSTKTTEIKITFDGVTATVLAATESEIKFTLPTTEKLLPKLLVTIENRIIKNNVVNNYNKNIGVLPKPPIDTWFTIENGIKKDTEIVNMQMQSDKILYYSMLSPEARSYLVYRTLDGGVTWVEWSWTFLYGIFYATSNDEGWSDSGFGIKKIAVGGYHEGSSIINTSENIGACVFVQNDMMNGIYVSTDGDVFVTHDGLNFTQEFTSSINKIDNNTLGYLSQSQVIDGNHIWVVGYKKIKNSNEYSENNKPFILYKNNMTDGWKEKVFTNESNYVARQVCFVDMSTGFLLINKYNDTVLSDVKLYKTTDGGDNWTPLYNGEKFRKFAFKDAMTGWAILDNKIYKTINGGSAWTLDYTHDQPIRNIAYKNNVVWAISQDKMIRRYL